VFIASCSSFGRAVSEVTVGTVGTVGRVGDIGNWLGIEVIPTGACASGAGANDWFSPLLTVTKSNLLLANLLAASSALIFLFVPTSK
jgi:hypothetical protein